MSVLVGHGLLIQCEMKLIKKIGFFLKNSVIFNLMKVDCFMLIHLW